jgi:uncharacterized protein YdhG (YjbR/CyaY superfamily)
MATRGMGRPAKDVNSYLAALPPAQRSLLKKVRAAVKTAAPKATEKISYRMPLYFHLGYLVGFAAFKDHCSFFVMSYKVMESFEEKLRPFRAATATLHFTSEKPLPVALIKKIVRARMKENEEKKARHSKRKT